MDKKMPVLYQCIICQHVNISVMDLHNHHIQYHNVKELSQTIINLKGFKIYNDITHAKPKCLKPINLEDDNNNESLYGHVMNKTKLDTNHAYKNEQINNSTRRQSHDKVTCLANCSQFIPWEHELNKRTEINDEDFSNIIESLCCDLNNRKRVGRKKKETSYIDLTNTTNVIQPIKDENLAEMQNTVLHDMDNGITQTATSSFWNRQHTIVNATNIDAALEIQKENKMQHVENNETKIVSLNKNTDVNKTDIVYNMLDSNFSWSSIITEHIREDDVSTDDENVYTVSMEPSIENLLS